MRLLIEQAEVKDQKKDDNNGKNPEENGFPFTFKSEERECEYVRH